jgi:hypothetical protein
MQEALRERRQRNQEAAIAGEVAGTIVPAIVPSGSSIAAKGASAGFRTAATAGNIVEKATAKGLQNLIGQTGKSKLATEVIRKSIPKAAGSSVEGAFYGAGQLVSEEALGNAEFNAQNFIASAGAGALIGGAAGGILGSAEALVPIIKNNKVVDVVSKKINTNIDQRLAGAKLAKMTPGEITKMKDTKWGQQIYDNIPEYFKKNLKLNVTDNTEKLFKKSQDELIRLGDEIGDTALQVDALIKDTNLGLTKAQVANRVQKSLEELTETFKKSPDLNSKNSLKKLNNRIRSWDEWLTDNSKLTAVELKELKTNLQQAAKWNKSIDQIPLDGQADRKIADAVRQEFLDLADKVSTVDENIGAKLRKLNIDYGTGMVLTNKLRRAVDKEASADILQFKDILVADILTDISGGFGLATAGVVTKKFLESDFRRKLTLLADVERANQRITKKLSSGVSSFFTNAKKTITPLSTKILMQSSFNTPDELGRKRKKPETKQQAFKQLSESIIELSSNPEKLLTHLSTNALLTTGAAPMTASAMTQTITTAISFLKEKLPTDPTIGSSLFPRNWEPSTIELSKFERYLAAVENPMSVVEDLESGSMTREGVEALQVVYPDIYSRLQEKAIEHISKTPDLPYNKRIQIGILLDVPADASLIGQNIAGLQQTFADEQQQKTAALKGETEIKTNQSGINKIDFASDAETETQRIATRE